MSEPHYYSPRLEEFKTFCYSLLLTTFNSPFGHFKYKRHAFGLSLTQGVLQKKVKNTLGDIHGCYGLADAIIIIVGVNEDGSDHEATLKRVLECAREKGTRFNPDKMVCWFRQIPLICHIICETGIRPDPDKARAITEIVAPSDKKELQIFLWTASWSVYISLDSILVGLHQSLQHLMLHSETCAQKDAEFVLMAVHK